MTLFCCQEAGSRWLQALLFLSAYDAVLIGQRRRQIRAQWGQIRLERPDVS